jgi:hypothetical protein
MVKPSSFRALDSKMSRFHEFRRVSGNGLGTAEWMPSDSAETNRRGGFDFGSSCALALSIEAAPYRCRSAGRGKTLEER